VVPAAAALDAIAGANPAARHPVHDLVDLLHRAHRSGEVPAHLRAALALRPGDPGLQAALAAALSEHGEIDEVAALFQRVTEVRPGDADAWSNLGKAEAVRGQTATAEAAFAQARTLAPSNAQVRLNHAVARLRCGDFGAGWTLFRARHALHGRPAPLPGPELTSLEGVAGRTLLLVHDEGFGDTLQFIRYAPLLTGFGARVLALVPPPLQRLLSENGIETVQSVPKHDAWCRIPDLPAVFGTTLAEIPHRLPYLAAPPSRAARWSEMLPPGRRVGLVWAGAARTHDPAATATDRVRSIRPERLRPLLAAPGIAWVSLQHGAAPPPGVFNPMPGVTDFADTAAIIASLDAVVSVDTAVAHLAAAMGRRVLLLDRFDNCWRWLSGRADSPWYPGVLHILRQPRPGDWDDVLRRAALALTASAEPRQSSGS